MKNILSSVSLVFFVLLGLITSVRAYTDVSASVAEGMVNNNDQLIVVDVRELGEVSVGSHRTYSRCTQLSLDVLGVLQAYLWELLPWMVKYWLSATVVTVVSCFNFS